MTRTSSRLKALAAVDAHATTKTQTATVTKVKSTTRKRKEREAEEEEEKCGSCDEKGTTANYELSEEEAEETVEATKLTKKRKTTTATAKRKSTTTKASQEDEMFAARTAISTLKKAVYIGAHVSSAGGVQNSVSHAFGIGANAFALFLKSQRKWESPPLADEARTGFRELTAKHSYDAAAHVLPHGSYLVNLAQADPTKAAQAYNNFVDDLRRCHQLGIRLYNFHPGNTGGASREEACARIAAQLNRAHADDGTGSVVTVLENMAGQGNVIGTRFEDLRLIIDGVADKSRVGVCIDTCHAFAAGYDLRTREALEATMAEFDRVVGISYLRAFHLNDSKAPFGSHRDLHANIGTGFLGLAAFHAVVNHPPFQNLPMVLETPIERKGPDGKTFEDKRVWAEEIKLLESLLDMDVESDEFKKLDVELQAKGASERTRIQEQVDKKAATEAKKKEKEAAKAAKARKTGKSTKAANGKR